MNWKTDQKERKDKEEGDTGDTVNVSDKCYRAPEIEMNDNGSEALFENTLANYF